MTDLAGVIRSLLFRHPTESSPVPGSVELLDDGTFHVDYHDPEYVYLVTVRQVPRVRLPLDRSMPVGEVAGVPAELVQVSIANHVDVLLDAGPGPSRDAASNDFAAAYRQWERQAEPDTPPPWPGEQLGAIALAVSDDVGTSYRRVSGQTGGPGKEWQVRWSFRPTPPATAGRLTLDFTPPAGAAVRIDLPLPPASDPGTAGAVHQINPVGDET
ncbi:hypothetical protein [Plantactinospora soyae]|uniref:Uncharacterized protein n=1 Tax=Plantactinospora soyae TaxID=1544732 RepID=A0A927QV61_9ACTN|nr:hypothetical protein [Plantactinospora soyae]MBE1485355.1 hypothetical protein [Plantactinospora soyae]